MTTQDDADYLARNEAFVRAHEAIRSHGEINRVTCDLSDGGAACTVRFSDARTAACAVDADEGPFAFFVNPRPA